MTEILVLSLAAVFVFGNVKFWPRLCTAKIQLREDVERLVGLENDFFARIGVNEYLCWIGKAPPYNAPNYYFLSREDMAHFGVTHVQTPPGYESTDVSDFSDHMMYIKLREP